MEKETQSIEIKGIIGNCGHRRVFMAFAPASLLRQTSFPDVMDEDTGLGYQRPIHARHSMGFRQYIQQPGATTIPLTFNLRSNMQSAWRMNEQPDGTAILVINPRAKVFAQVDCQHRLGFLDGINVPLAFMSFLGLTIEEEREIFTTINSKSKGLSGTLIDTNTAKLVQDLATEAPDLYVAISLADDKDSPWYNRLKKGGQSSLGLKKLASLRMMKNAALRLFRELRGHNSFTVEMTADAAKKFWQAIAFVYPDAWREPRYHYIAKGVGIYSLMSLAGQMTSDALTRKLDVTEAYFAGELSDHLPDFDWSHSGPLETFNGAKGADQALQFLRAHMKKRQTSEGKDTWPTRISS
jgi:DGQHR domain-containing protein